MLSAFESMVRRSPQRTCFTYVDEAGVETSFSYREVRMMSVAVAMSLRNQGVKPDSCVVVDLPNCPLYVFILLGAAYGGYAVVALNFRLTVAEKMSRIMEIEHKPGIKIAMRIDEGNAARLEEKAHQLLVGGDFSANARSGRAAFSSRAVADSAEVRSAKALGRAGSGRDSIRRRNEVSRQEAVESLIHFAEHSARVFDSSSRALVMFTSGTTGRAKAVALSWHNLCSSSVISNKALNRRGEGLWQAALPLCHVGGLQVIIRSLMNSNPFVLYRTFDADQILDDAVRKGATHISVVDAMLQALLRDAKASNLSRYSCVLLGGGALNPATLEAAYKLCVRVYASYGMTETSSQIAHSIIDTSFRGGLKLLPGYDAHIVDPGEDGFGRLAVKGPGLFKGYLNARAAYTVDGYFLTGDTAALYQGCLFVKERTEDMFVSGGENVYPEEIRQKLLGISGVADVHVFGVPDERWGRRPVAFLERVPGKDNFAAAPQFRDSDAYFRAILQKNVDARLSKLNRPKHLCVIDQFPRAGIGKTDKKALEDLYDRRLEVAKVTLYRIRVPFIVPFKTPKETLVNRESIIVEVTDHAGRIGLGECVSFSTDWYLPETLDQDVQAIRTVLAPLVLSTAYLHPREVSEQFALYSNATACPMACGAIEPALWDLYGKIVQKPLWRLIGGKAKNSGFGSDQSTTVPAGAVIGLGSTQETLEAARSCVAAGYRRVKLKAVPGKTLESVKAIRAAFPSLMITLDANQSFNESHIEELRTLSLYNVAWIEEPLNPFCTPSRGGATGVLERLSTLQNSMKTPICLDESIEYPRDLTQSLEFKNLNCYAVKIGKLGGIQPALNFVSEARRRGISLWMGGMYDMGVSKRMHAAFETLEGISAPGDIGSVARYFSSDITDPPYTAERGFVTLNRGGHPYGLGCELNYSVLSSVLSDKIVIE